MAIQLFKNKAKARAIHYAYANTFNMDDVHDKLVIQDLCSAHNVFSSTFDFDDRQHAFNEGERNVVLRILTILGLTQDEILQLIEED